MTASELGFLAIGLILGLVTGAALVELYRARPAPRREVRLTVSHDAIPRRATTLADDAFAAAGPEPARGGPADRRSLAPSGGPVGVEPRTPVRSEPIYGPVGGPSVRGAIPIRPDPAMADSRPPAGPGRGPADPRLPVPGRVMEPALPLRDPRAGRPDVVERIERYAGEPIGIPVSGGTDPALRGLTEVPVGAVAGPVARPAAAAVSSIRTEPSPPATAPRRVEAVATRSTVDRPAAARSPWAVARGIEPGLEPATAQRIGSPAPPMDERAAPRNPELGSPADPPHAMTATRDNPGAPRDNARTERDLPGEDLDDAPLEQGGPSLVATLEPATSTRTTIAPTADERCAEERRIADERCELAARAREHADSAATALRAAQRAYDGHEAAAVTASWRADPRAVHDAKDQAQGGFRAAVRGATTPDQLEAAARDWLTEINRINTEAREAAAAAAREHKAAATIGATLERLGLEADAARIAAANADAACLAARAATADCEEQANREPAAHAPSPEPVGRPDLPRPDDDELGSALEAGGAPRIFRLLRGDRAAMTSLVASLAGSDREERRRWQLQLTSLVEAIVANAIEDAALDFPAEHEFWSEFPRSQSRDIVRALSSLGYRFDGLGGWTDGRHPSQRDLSLALGYAGIDPMRIRRWPSESAMEELFGEVTVAADEYLAGTAGDLTLAEMVTTLGRRADALADIWNTWGRIRPLLLDEA